MGVEDWFPQRPHFLQLCQLLYFLGTLLPYSLGIRLHRGIQYLLMDTVGGTIGFSISVVPTAHIFHTTLSVPATDHRNERIPTFPAGQQPRVTVLGLIAVCGASLLFEQALYLLPFLFSDDHRKESLMTIPVGFVNTLDLTVVILPAIRAARQIPGRSPTDLAESSSHGHHHLTTAHRAIPAPNITYPA